MNSAGGLMELRCRDSDWQLAIAASDAGAHACERVGDAGHGASGERVAGKCCCYVLTSNHAH